MIIVMHDSADFNFHSQVYRADGETIALQPGEYTVNWTRGPEYKILTRKITVPAAKTHTETFKLRRWVHLAKKGWWSGDHHIHAAGCKHYSNPSEGVFATDMARHCRGEDLKIGANLTWGPCFDFQKQFFTGKEDMLMFGSSYPHWQDNDLRVPGAYTAEQRDKLDHILSQSLGLSSISLRFDELVELPGGGRGRLREVFRVTRP